MLFSFLLAAAAGRQASSQQHTHIEIGANNATGVVHDAIRHGWSKLFLFEPNPFWFPTMNYLIKHAATMGLRVEHVPHAAWIRSEPMTFHVHAFRGGIGSSRYDDALYTAGMSKPVEIQAVDLADWMLKNIPPDAALSVHMDIEGAEYAVMRRLIHTGQACRIHDLTFEGHALYRADHAPFQMFDALLPWLLAGCPSPPRVHLKRHYGRRRARGSTSKHDPLIKWTVQHKEQWCFSCRLLDNLVDTTLL
jgi:FkbM family methyltransferase